MLLHTGHSSLFSAVTLVAIGDIGLLYFNVGKQTEMMYPYSYTYEVTSLKWNKKVDQASERIQRDHPVEKDLTIKTLQVAGIARTRIKSLMCQKNWMTKNKPTIICLVNLRNGRILLEGM
ncbi:hypothetical protein P7H16_06925 [Paenibacillus larvae]|nr:hypothetical protein [Paenibacillus larvae]MDT2246735.1 hypothetical protein [Paenibacillus larvae]